MMPENLLSSPRILQLAKQVLQTEQEAIARVQLHLGEDFVNAVQLLLSCKGRIVVTGMGKSGHIARKIAATLASTGSPALFVHPAEAAHGDLGMITRQDVVLALSNSGESNEVVLLIPSLKRQHIALIGMTSAADSSLAKAAEVHLDTLVTEEACPLGLAPSASTTVALALGDALALALSDARGFSAQDFAMTHPGGSLGRRLLITVADVMHAGAGLPVVTPQTTVREALFEISGKGLGMTAVCDEAGQLVGVFTDGDLRRALDKGLEVLSLPVAQVMTAAPRVLLNNQLASEALYAMETYKVNGMPVLSPEGALLGMLNMHDLLRAGIV